MNQNILQKILIIGIVILLVGAIFGSISSYELLRWNVAGLCVLLSLISITTRRYYWTIIFFVFGLLFNPIDPFYFDRSMWILFDIALVGILLFWFYDYFASYHKGLVFEKYVHERFPDSEWSIVSATKDLHKKLHRFVETDGDPDFVFRNRVTGNQIAIECKYRSNFMVGFRDDLGIWWKKRQGERYMKYAIKNNIVVYIAFGIGGNPKSPGLVAYIPLTLIQTQYPHFIPKNIFLDHTAIPRV